MSAKKKREKPPRHTPSYESMISWGCICGARWMNEELKKPDGYGGRVSKTDEELIEERDRAFDAHVSDMIRQGFA